MLNALGADERVGAVGARLIDPDGRLQEAGSIVWRDGTCVGYGQGDDPDAPMYAFARDVDFCSAAFLLTPRTLFEQLGGFDTAYGPAYYEDVDYCARLWQAGYRVRYDPRVTVRHYESASSRSSEHAISAQLARRLLFVARHQEWLQEQPVLAPNALEARARHHRTTNPRLR